MLYVCKVLVEIAENLALLQKRKGEEWEKVIWTIHAMQNKTLSNSSWFLADRSSLFWFKSYEKIMKGFNNNSCN